MQNKHTVMPPLGRSLPWCLVRDILLPYLDCCEEAEEEWLAAVRLAVSEYGAPVVAAWVWTRYDARMRQLASRALGANIYEDLVAAHDTWLTGSLCLTAFFPHYYGGPSVTLWLPSESARRFDHLRYNDWDDWERVFPRRWPYNEPCTGETAVWYEAPDLPGVQDAWALRGRARWRGVRDVEFVELSGVSSSGEVRAYVERHSDVAILGALAWRPGVPVPENWEAILLDILHLRSEFRVSAPPAAEEVRSGCQYYYHENRVPVRAIERFARYSTAGLALHLRDESVLRLRRRLAYLPRIRKADWDVRKAGTRLRFYEVADGEVVAGAGAEAGAEEEEAEEEEEDPRERCADWIVYGATVPSAVCPGKCILERYCKGVPPHVHLGKDRLGYPLHALVVEDPHRPDQLAP